MNGASRETIFFETGGLRTLATLAAPGGNAPFRSGGRFTY